MTTMALLEFASRSFLAKVHLKKNPEVEKLDGNRTRIQPHLGIHACSAKPEAMPPHEGEPRQLKIKRRESSAVECACGFSLRSTIAGCETALTHLASPSWRHLSAHLSRQGREDARVGFAQVAREIVVRETRPRVTLPISVDQIRQILPIFQPTKF